MEALFPVKEDKRVRTEHGAVTVHVCSTGKTDFYFLPRHGREHEIPPHLINHKANLRALTSLGVGGVIATGAVGAISTKIKVGGIGLLDQFIDMSARHLTFFEGSPIHADMTNPYDRGLQEAIASAASRERISLSRGLTYVSVHGPRYETAAEIRMFRLLGGDVVGMTGAPEAILSNELGIKYGSIVVATNKAAGLQAEVSHEEVLSVMASSAGRVTRLIRGTMDALRSDSP